MVKREHSLPRGMMLHTIANIICIPCFLFNLIPINIVLLTIYVPLNVVAFACMLTDKRPAFGEIEDQRSTPTAKKGTS